MNKFYQWFENRDDSDDHYKRYPASLFNPKELMRLHVAGTGPRPGMKGFEYHRPGEEITGGNDYDKHVRSYRSMLYRTAIDDLRRDLKELEDSGRGESDFANQMRQDMQKLIKRSYR